MPRTAWCQPRAWTNLKHFVPGLRKVQMLLGCGHWAQQERAAEVKAAVLTALPFGRARLFRAVRGKEVPDWARSFADTWAQFFLKYLLSDPRITAVIPGTADPAHMTDNVGAMRGPLPDPDQRKQMEAFATTL